MTGKLDFALLVTANLAVDLERVQGTKFFKGLCPKHSEQTPSFVVDMEAERFYCLGCGFKGDRSDLKYDN